MQVCSTTVPLCQKAKRREEAPAIFQLKYNFFLVLMFLHPFPAKKPRFSWKTSKNSSCTMQCSSLTKLKISPVRSYYSVRYIYAVSAGRDC